MHTLEVVRQQRAARGPAQSAVECRRPVARLTRGQGAAAGAAPGPCESWGWAASSGGPACRARCVPAPASSPAVPAVALASTAGPAAGAAIAAPQHHGWGKGGGFSLGRVGRIGIARPLQRAGARRAAACRKGLPQRRRRCGKAPCSRPTRGGRGRQRKSRPGGPAGGARAPLDLEDERKLDRLSERHQKGCGGRPTAGWGPTAGCPAPPAPPASRWPAALAFLPAPPAPPAPRRGRRATARAAPRAGRGTRAPRATRRAASGAGRVRR
jgi:hypothetical protein